MYTETTDTIEEVVTPQLSSQPTTLGSLGLRLFNEKGSTKAKCPIAAKITMKDYLDSKICGQNNNIVPYSGQQIVGAITSRVNEALGENPNRYGEVYVYRDHLRYDGYVETQTRDTQGMTLLHPGIPMSDLVFERVIGKIKLVDAGEYSQVLAFRYEPKFLEVAIGTNVNICQNFNIFGGKHFMSKQGFNFATMMDEVENILGNLQSHFKMDMTMIHQMQARPIQQKHIDHMLGHMMQEYHKNELIIPLQDITALSSQIIKSENPTATVWDFVNRGTEVLRFDNNSGEAIMQNIRNFNDYTCSYIPN